MFQFELFSRVAESLPLLDSDETATFAVAGHLDLDGDAVFEFLAVGDDADAAVALAGYLLEFLEGCHDGIEAVVVEGAEAFVDEQDVDVHVGTIQGGEGEGEGEGDGLGSVLGSTLGSTLGSALGSGLGEVVGATEAAAGGAGGTSSGGEPAPPLPPVRGTTEQSRISSAPATPSREVAAADPTPASFFL